MTLTVIPDFALLLLAQTESAAAPVTSAAAGNLSVLGYIQSGGLLSYILIVLSMLALGLIIANLIVLRADYLMPQHVIGAIDRLLRDRNIEGVFAFAKEKENDRFLTRVMAGGLSKAARSQFGMLELKPALEEAAAKELDKLDRPTHAISVLAAVGPMLGLLGTVFGMIGAFRTISGETGAARSAKLAEFMSLALVCTAEGLVLAIPCTIAYSLFRRRTDRLMGMVADTAERLAASLQTAGGPAPRPAATPVARPAAAPAPIPVPVSAIPAPVTAAAPASPLPPATPRAVAPTGPA